MSVTISGNSGLVLQAVSVVKSDTFSSTVKGSYVAVTGLSASITPISANSKILVLSTITTGTLNNLALGFHVYRNGSVITPNGPSTGFTPASVFTQVAGGTAVNTGVSATLPCVYLDSPASTSTQTYQIYMACNSGAVVTMYVNPSTSSGGGMAGGSSTITLLEIAQ